MSLIIAEIGTSHEGDAAKARLMIDECAESGADCAKFQWVYADEILHPKTGFVNLPTGKIPLYDRFRQLECPVSFYKKMIDYTHSKGMKFCCSPFGLRSLEELLSLNPDYVKIASPELNHYPMLKKLAEYRKNQKTSGQKLVPVILSSGVSKMEDIRKAVEILGKEDVSLLHCITSYPAPETEYNLRIITNLKKELGIEMGVSDHSLDPVLVPVLSVAAGGTIIEKHITLSKKTMGLDDPVALEGEQFALMVHCVHQAEAALNRYGKDGYDYVVNQLMENAGEGGKEKIEAILGDGIKRLAPAEEANYGRTNRSIHFMRDIKKGEIISEKDVAVLRTEKILTPGISPEYLEKVIGQPLLNDVTDGSGLQFSDIPENFLTLNS
ncbi:MAG: N-acetylneuraminate synthase family protein [Treponema sp.]|nr:N-acetylneuraminate synthase family protein [Treponema sp.]